MNDSTQSGPRDIATIALPVLTPQPARSARVGRSKMGKRRAIVLILVHVAIAAHIIQWRMTGRTVSPVEPSESMQTLNNGLVNAGFIFFALALLSTLIVGRFFCGWGCHVVALQDACGWMLKKIGIRPAPFRSRLLIFAPLILALYMFVWPTLKRFIAPAVASWSPVLGAYMGPIARIPEEGLTNHLITDDFWATFPSVWVAIPFLLVCGFATVYFLGAKGFCTYGCPYGGFFAPMDLVAPGRIVVDHDKCEGCGHCTAVCTSNVRVHEEIREYGMVVDPGCMKCMDCVSVCPHDALSFAFRKPAIAKGRPRQKAPRRKLDTTLGEDLILAGVFLAVFLGTRGQYDIIPMLMAMGLGAIGAFLAWKCIQLVKKRDVRLTRFQIKRAGKLTPSGIAFALLALFLSGLTLHSLLLNQYKWRGTAAFNLLTPSADHLVRSLGADVPAEKGAQARRGAELFEKSLSIGSGGLGLLDNSTPRLRASLLRLQGGEPERAEALVAPLSARKDSPVSVVTYHAKLLLGLNRTGEALTLLHQRVRDNPRDWEALELWATTMIRNGPDAAREVAAQTEGVLASGRIPEYDARALARTTLTLGMTRRVLGERERAIELVREAASIAPDDRVCLEQWARIQMSDLRDPEASAETWGRVFEMDRRRLDAAMEFSRALIASGSADGVDGVFDRAMLSGADPAETALAQMTVGIEAYRWRPEIGEPLIRSGYARSPGDARVAKMGDQIRAGLGVQIDKVQ